MANIILSWGCDHPCMWLIMDGDGKKECKVVLDCKLGTLVEAIIAFVCIEL